MVPEPGTFTQPHSSPWFGLRIIASYKIQLSEPELYLSRRPTLTVKGARSFSAHSKELSQGTGLRVYARLSRIVFRSREKCCTTLSKAHPG
jgi:hypothetical protein